MTPRDKRLLALVAWLGAACERSAPPQTETPELAAPIAPSATIPAVIASTPGYTNEMQAERLRGEISELGIQSMGDQASEDDSSRQQVMTREEREMRRAQLRDITRQLAVARRRMSGQDKTVALPGETAILIAPKAQKGSPVTETDTAEDAAPAAKKAAH